MVFQLLFTAVTTLPNVFAFFGGVLTTTQLLVLQCEHSQKMSLLGQKFPNLNSSEDKAGA